MEHFFVACCVYRPWLFSLTERYSPETVLIAMKPEVHCTSVASTVSFFIGVGTLRTSRASADDDRAFFGPSEWAKFREL